MFLFRKVRLLILKIHAIKNHLTENILIKNEVSRNRRKNLLKLEIHVKDRAKLVDLWRVFIFALDLYFLICSALVKFFFSFSKKWYYFTLSSEAI